MRWARGIRVAVVVSLIATGFVLAAVRPPALKAAPGQPDRWSPEAPMAIARTGHSITMVDGGRILVAGGRDQGGRLLSSVEIYDPVQRTWTQGPPLSIPRAGHTASVLNRFVVVAGGDIGTGDPTPTVDILDANTATWGPGPPMAVGRLGHTATVVRAAGSNSFRLIVAGGTGAEGVELNTAESLPSSAFTRRETAWYPAGDFGATRTGLRAVAVAGPNCVVGTTDYGACNVLIVGGTDRQETKLLRTHPARLPGGVLPWYEWDSGPALLTARTRGHTMLTVDGEHCSSLAFRLPSCRTILVAGGLDGEGNPTTAAEIYDPADPSGEFQAAGEMRLPRAGHEATALADGRVLVTGGTTDKRVELYDLDNKESPWAYGGELAEARLEGHASVGLVNSRGEPMKRVLVVGGIGSLGGPATRNAEVYYAQTVKTFIGAPDMKVERDGHTATRLAAPDGDKVLVAGGSAEARAEVYTHDLRSGTGSWSFTAPMVQSRVGHTATLLRSGNVFVVGGRQLNIAIPETGSAASREMGLPLATAELYTTGPPSSWLPTAGQMRYPRAGHSATLLPTTGKVLVIGGVGPGGPESDRVRNASPAGNDPSSVPVVKVVEDDPAAEGAIASVELYDPATGRFTEVAPLPRGRYGHTATLLPSGKVLVVGGRADDGRTTQNAQATVQEAQSPQPIELKSALYDPGEGVGGTWREVDTPDSHVEHSATLLGGPGCDNAIPASYCGNVLVTGGSAYPTSLFDWRSETWTALGTKWASDPERFYGHTTTVLPSGLVFALVDRYGYTYDPGRGAVAPAATRWERAGEPLNRKWGRTTATLLGDGKVLLAGGREVVSRTGVAVVGATRAVEIYDGIAPPLDPPSGPGGTSAVGAVAVPGGVRLNWGAVPVDRDGGSRVTGYRVDLISVSPPNQARAATRRAVTVRDPNATSVVVKGLPLDDILVFEVAAMNEVGLGPWARVSFSNTGATPIPLAPTNVRAGAGNSSASVEWSPPPDNGAVIEGYKILPYRIDPKTGQPDPRVVRLPATPSAGAGTSAVVSGLSDGHLWAFAVRAVTAGGVEGAESARSQAVVPGLPRGKPRVVGAEARNRSTLVRFSPPPEQGAGPVTAYTVTAHPGGAMVTVGGKTGHAILPGLANGIEYRFRVRAANQYGPGTESSDLSEAVATPALGPPAVLTGVAPTLPAEVAPVVGDIHPRGGPASGGGEVVINGDGFGGATEVRFGDAPPVTFKVVSPHQIVAVAPRFSAPGRVHVTVTGPGGTSTFKVETSEDSSFTAESAYYFGSGGWESSGFSSGASRQVASATALKNGKLLVTGPAAGDGGGAEARIYDPQTGAWAQTAAPTKVPTLAIRLSNGKVLALTRGVAVCTTVSNVYDDCDDPQAVTQLFDPAGGVDGNGAWEVLGASGVKKTAASGSATEIAGGKILVTGGCCNTKTGFYTDAPVTASEVFDPDTKTWTETPGRPNYARNGHTLTTLTGTNTDCGNNCGLVLAVGGFRRPIVLGPNYGDPEPLVHPPELFDPGTGTWRPAPPMKLNRYGHTATLLPDGKVLVAGGSTVRLRDAGTETINASATAEIYDPAANAWKDIPPMPRVRYNHTATLLPSGQVLVAGGIGPRPLKPGEFGTRSDPVTVADLYDTATNTWVPAGSEHIGGARTAVSLPSPGACGVNCGKVMLLGGSGDVELYSPAPVVTAVSPTSTAAGEAPEITITGRGLANDAEVLVGGVAAEVIERSHTTLKVQPSAAPRNSRLPIAVTTTGGEALSAEPFVFTGLPGAVKNLSATPAGTDGVGLAFGAAGSVGDANPPAQSYVIKQSRVPLTEANFGDARSLCEETEGVCTYEIANTGDVLNVDVATLSPNTTYFWAVRPKVGDVLGPMSTVSATTGTVLPGAVNDLLVKAESTRRALLSFSVTGLDAATDPPATDYVIRFSRSPITAESFETDKLLCEPVCSFVATAVGQRVELPISELAAGTRYWFALRAVGHGGRLGPMSSVVEMTTIGLAPGRVTDLVATAVSAGEVALSFAAPGSPDADSPPASSYVIKQSKSPIVDVASFDAARTLCGGVCRFSPQKVGDELTLSVTGLAPSTTYHYAIRVRHQDGTLGELSNISEATTLAPCAPVGPAGANQASYTPGYHLVSVPSGTRLPAPVLYGWFNQGSGRYSFHDPATAESGRGYWAWFACPQLVDLATGGPSSASFPLGAYRASIVGNPSVGAPATISGHDFAATWDPAANNGSGAYRLSGFGETVALGVGQAAWAFAYKDTTVSIGPR